MSEEKSQCLVEPGRGFFKVQASECVLFLPAGPFARIFAGRFFARKKSSRPYPARLYRLKRNGVEIDLVGPAMGAPVAGMVLEQLIAGGAKKVLALGFAGAIDPGLKIGDLLLVAEAISDEGTSQCYFPEVKSFPGSESLLSGITFELKARAQEFQIGKVVSTDGFFRETQEKLEKFRTQGARAVEMELSALYAIARFRGIELLGMVIISDELYGEEWRTGFKSPGMVLKFLSAGQMALSVLATK